MNHLTNVQEQTAQSADTMIRCPTCHGKGEVNALTNFNPHTGRNERVACIPCGGRGFMTLGKLKRHRNSVQTYRRPW